MSGGVLLADYAAVRLSRMQSVILRALILHDFVSHSRMSELLWGGDPEGGPISARDCYYLHLQSLRGRLGPGVTIETVHGQGLRLVVRGPDVEVAA